MPAEVVSNEKIFGSKSNGDGARTTPFVGNDGDSDGANEELGDSSSGFAIRRPPRDWERLKSPSMIHSRGQQRTVFVGR